MKAQAGAAVSVAIAAAVAALLRFYVVEPEELAHLCGARCALR
jgi:AMMECR1 domain-containing protein